MRMDSLSEGNFFYLIRRLSRSMGQVEPEQSVGLIQIVMSAS